jgi:hypothetical protein
VAGVEVRAFTLLFERIPLIFSRLSCLTNVRDALRVLTGCRRPNTTQSVPSPVLNSTNADKPLLARTISSAWNLRECTVVGRRPLSPPVDIGKQSVWLVVTCSVDPLEKDPEWEPPRASVVGRTGVKLSRTTEHSLQTFEAEVI